MKKLSPPHSTSITVYGVQITHDDLDELVHLFQRDLSAPKIFDGSFEYESLDEFFAQRGHRPRKLEIESASPESAAVYIRADFEDGQVTLRGTKDTPFQEAKDYLLAHRPWSYTVFNPWVGMVATCALLPLVASMSDEPNKFNPQAIQGAKLALWLSFGLMVGGAFYRKAAFGVKSTRRRNGSFWTKHGDKIVGGVIGAIMTGIVQWLLRQFSSG